MDLEVLREEVRLLAEGKKEIGRLGYSNSTYFDFIHVTYSVIEFNRSALLHIGLLVAAIWASLGAARSGRESVACCRCVRSR